MVFTIAGFEFKMLPMPSGAFQMGSPETEKERDEEEVPHQVEINNPFLLGETPVTQEVYQAVMGANPSDDNTRGPRRPVTNVSWDDTQKFCEKLAVLLKRKFRLPTEAEWEYACRAGTTTPFFSGKDFDSSLANFDGGEPYGKGKKGVDRGTTTDVGIFPPNPWGLYDMHGNVREWCADWYGDYSLGYHVDPQGLRWGEERVARGGSWFHYAVHCRAAARDYNSPDSRINNLGFRLAASIGF